MYVWHFLTFRRLLESEYDPSSSPIKNEIKQQTTKGKFHPHHLLELSVSFFQLPGFSTVQVQLQHTRIITDVPAVHLYAGNVGFTTLPTFDSTGTRHFGAACELRGFVQQHHSPAHLRHCGRPGQKSLFQTLRWGLQTEVAACCERSSCRGCSANPFYTFWTSGKAYTIGVIITRGDFSHVYRPWMCCEEHRVLACF